MKPAAKALIKRFGSFAGVMAASPDALGEIDGIGEASIVALKTVQAAALLMQKQDITEKAGAGVMEIGTRLLPFRHGA